jgi:TonB family protein
MTPLLLALLLAAPQVPPERARTLNGEPVNTLFTDEDYPPAALRANEEGRVQVRLHIGTDGIVSSCDITTSSNSASLDSTTCRLLSERARFRPARDAAGKAVGDSHVAAIVWKIADEDEPPPALAAAIEAFLGCLGPKTEAALAAAPGRPIREAAEAVYPACQALEGELHRQFRASMITLVEGAIASRRAAAP